MKFYQEVLFFLGLNIPVTMMIGFILFGTIITADLAVAVIQAMLGLAPIPVIVNNYRQKIGQSVVAMTTLGSGLLSIGTIFLLTAGLPITAIVVLISGVLWSVLAVQAFLYAKPAVPKPVEHCAVCDTPMEDGGGIGPYCPDRKCGNSDGPTRKMIMEAWLDLQMHGHGEYHDEKLEGCEKCIAHRVLPSKVLPLNSFWREHL